MNLTPLRNRLIMMTKFKAGMLCDLELVNRIGDAFVESDGLLKDLANHASSYFEFSFDVDYLDQPFYVVFETMELGLEITIYPMRFNFGKQEFETISGVIVGQAIIMSRHWKDIHQLIKQVAE